MFSRAVQPPVLSLFSSTSSECLSLFSVHTDPSLLSDSFVHLLDDESSQPEPPPPKVLIIPIGLDDAKGREGDTSNTNGFSISAPVLHIQSPTLRSGYIRCPPTHWRPHAAQRDRDLGIKLGWIHVQVRNMGREWCFEVGVVDQAGREGRIRCSTFQVRYTISVFGAAHDEACTFCKRHNPLLEQARRGLPFYMSLSDSHPPPRARSPRGARSPSTSPLSCPVSLHSPRSGLIPILPCRVGNSRTSRLSRFTLPAGYVEFGLPRRS
jgi:CFA20 domain